MRARPEVREVVALIRPENAASAKAFERAGYVPAGDEAVSGVSLLRFILRRKGFAFGGRWLGPDAPALLVAELSANHGGRWETALAAVRAMKDAGADAVKLQTYTADTITIDAPQEHFRIKQGTLWDGRTLHDLYREAMTPWDWQPRLKEEAEKLGMACFSSPFDLTAVDFLESLGVPAYKIASFEITDIPLISYAASKGKPVLLSTGVARYAEIAEAVAACRAAGNDRIALLKCTSAYPALPEEANLSVIPDLAEQFGTVVGLSDHTLGHSLAVAAVALGARIVEKHFILDRGQGGPDSAFSLEPAEFKSLVAAVREAEAAVGEVTYEPTPKAAASRIFMRSLFVVADVKKGEVFDAGSVRSIRPGLGLPPRCLTEVLGRRASRDITRGTPLTRDLIE
ncbi:MAG: pseudaminic acid synthase [Elusimicrobia bacterium]|nr:pseudaminic acid synthase [Elusimicrobiota bacterium]